MGWTGPTSQNNKDEVKTYIVIGGATSGSGSSGPADVYHPGPAYSPSPSTNYHHGPAYSPSPSTAYVAGAPLVDMVKKLQQEVESLRRQLAEPQKYLCEVATKFCAPGTKWINGNCVATFDGIVSACENARPGWEWTCKSAQQCTT